MTTELRTPDEAAHPPAETHLPGDVSMWIFVLGEIVFFGGFFIIFMVVRSYEPRLFLRSQQHLNLTLGVLNTLVLILSSRFAAEAVRATKAGDRERARREILLAAGCGVVFVVLKGVEWGLLTSAGFTVPHNDFFMFYFLLTGVHLFHLLLGLIVLGVVRREVRSDQLGRPWVVEAGTTYWHMVDLLWVVLFALLYLMR